MGGKAKLALALLVAVLLAAGLAACGGGEDSTSSSSAGTAAKAALRDSTDSPPADSAGQQKGKSADHSSTGSSGQGSGDSKGEPGKSSSGQGQSGGGSGASPEGSNRATGKSAEPSAEFRVPNGDNSIQTYGAEAGDADREAASAVLEAYMAARASGDLAKACAQLLGATFESLEAVLAPSSGCAATLAAVADRLAPSAWANTMTGPIASLRREGDHAFALYHGTQGIDYFMQMSFEGVGWKVAAIEPTPFP